MPPQEAYRHGIDYLEAATELLQRVRSTHPTAGILEAADLNWWWRTPRTTDNLRQLFWFDHEGHPEAAVIATRWVDGVSLDPIVMPDATSEWIAHVVERGANHAEQSGLSSVGFTVGCADVLMNNALEELGFTINDDNEVAIVDAWKDTNAPSMISPLHPDYRLSTRVNNATCPHHMTKRSGPNVETRLRQTPLYRADLDLLVLDRQNNVAAYGLFWLDPKTATGLVEPIRTEDGHQRRGLARHLITYGISCLAAAGACRVKVCFRRDNPIAERLYLSVGFEANKHTVAFTRPVRASR